MSTLFNLLFRLRNRHFRVVKSKKSLQDRVFRTSCFKLLVLRSSPVPNQLSSSDGSQLCHSFMLKNVFNDDDKAFHLFFLVRRFLPFLGIGQHTFMNEGVGLMVHGLPQIVVSDRNTGMAQGFCHRQTNLLISHFGLAL